MLTPTYFANLYRHATPTGLSAAIRSAAERATPRLRVALYEATRVSDRLASAMAVVYPFTFCAHEGCVCPLAHDGHHLTVADGTALPPSATLAVVEPS